MSSGCITFTGYYEVTIIPSKASHISITEKSNSSSITLALSYPDGSPIFNGDYTIGPGSQTKYAAGTLFTYNRPAETIKAAGPIDQPLIVRMLYKYVHGNRTDIVYSYDVPSSVPIRDNKNAWLSKRSNCSVRCGKGELSLRC